MKNFKFITLILTLILGTQGFGANAKPTLDDRDKAIQTLMLKLHSIHEDIDLYDSLVAKTLDDILIFKEYNDLQKLTTVRAFIMAHPVQANFVNAVSMVLFNKYSGQAVAKALTAPEANLIQRLLQKFPALSKRMSPTLAVGVTAFGFYYTFTRTLEYQRLSLKTNAELIAYYEMLVTNLRAYQDKQDTLATEKAEIMAELNIVNPSALTDAFPTK